MPTRWPSCSTSGNDPTGHPTTVPTPAGATVIVDEAGMIGTGALDRLIRLTERQGWRLALVGDPYQLQAVGRGGMFHELCTTGRTHHLAHIHRFHQPWEAAASLQLRHGDPAAVDTYIHHGRVHPGEFDEHLDHIADLWLDANSTARRSPSPQQPTNTSTRSTTPSRPPAPPPVSSTPPCPSRSDTDNTPTPATSSSPAATTARSTPPPANPSATANCGPSPPSTTAHLHVTSRHGAGDAVLPADYVAEHVQLGYAATEHGNQSDTVDIGIELVTAATGRRGLYVGATRGRDTNQLLVVTNDHDPDTARDLLHPVLANDRADTPATSPTPQPRPSGSASEPADTALRDPSVVPSTPTPGPTRPGRRTDRVASDRQRITDLDHDLADAHRQVAEAERNLAPYRPGLAAADRDVASPRAATRRLQPTPAQRTPRCSRARRDVAAADHAYEAASPNAADTQAVAQPAQDRSSQASARVRSIEAVMRSTHTLQQWNGNSGRVSHLEQLTKALKHWQRWAQGHPVRQDVLSRTLDVLRQTSQNGPHARSSFIASVNSRPARGLTNSSLATHLDRGIGFEL